MTSAARSQWLPSLPAPAAAVQNPQLYCDACMRIVIIYQ